MIPLTKEEEKIQCEEKNVIYAKKRFTTGDDKKKKNILK